jgi:hypothetical protein
MSEFWFEPKRYGYGATPTSWQGWALTIGYVLVLAALGLPLLALQEAGGSDLGLWLIPAWLAGIAMTTIVFLRICRARTNGAWRWRWGEKV